MITTKQIEKILYTIPDPELGVSIMDLGLIYEVKVVKNTVEILMTLTTIGCPLFSLISQPMKTKVLAVKGVKEVVINLTFEPPWTPDRMSMEAKNQLGLS